jgi:hypothetical protein
MEPQLLTGQEIVDTIQRQAEYESAFTALYVLAHFDHEFADHILVQQYDTFVDQPRREYHLYARTGDGTALVASWDGEGGIPFVEAAVIVAEWRKGAGW